MSTVQSLKQRMHNREELVALRVDVAMDRNEIDAAIHRRSYDMLYIEGQHSPFTEDQLVAFCKMAEEIDIPVKLRVPHTQQAYLVGRYYDFGPVAIIVPEVEEEFTVEEALKYTYYPPKGKRSYGGSLRYGINSKAAPGLQSYAQWWNEQAVLGIMIESIEAISNARRFVKPGLDFIAFGTSDLQLSIDGNPEFPLRTPDECMRYVADQVRDQIPLGLAFPVKPEERDKYRQMGITIFQDSLVPR